MKFAAVAAAVIGLVLTATSPAAAASDASGRYTPAAAPCCRVIG